MSTATLRPSTFTPQPQEKLDETKFEYPGIPTTCDGAEAVVHVEIHVAQAAGAYPITSSTTMGGGFNAAVMNGKKTSGATRCNSSSPKASTPPPRYVKGSPSQGAG